MAVEETKVTEEKKPAESNSQEPEAEEQPAVVKEEEKISEPEEEQSQPTEKESTITEEAETVASTLVTESQVDEEEEDADNMYVLLDRLFKFIKMEPGKTEEEQLNPVLSGYFCKLVSLLISRK